MAGGRGGGTHPLPPAEPAASLPRSPARPMGKVGRSPPRPKHGYDMKARGPPASPPQAQRTPPAPLTTAAPARLRSPQRAHTATPSLPPRAYKERWGARGGAHSHVVHWPLSQPIAGRAPPEPRPAGRWREDGGRRGGVRREA